MRDGELLDQSAIRIGLRTLELRQKPDSWGKSFAFVINGVPVFAKGGNWIPADSFPSRITKDRYRQLIKSVRDTNMNMLRVWGGGIYESDDFYDLCDELGILVWQDFMFACSMYPGDREFLENVRQEAVDNVKRLRHHPSIVIWCGNNEVETAWMHWGWKENLPAKLWDDYKASFTVCCQAFAPRSILRGRTGRVLPVPIWKTILTRRRWAMFTTGESGTLLFLSPIMKNNCPVS